MLSNIGKYYGFLNLETKKLNPTTNGNHFFRTKKKAVEHVNYLNRGRGSFILIEFDLDTMEKKVIEVSNEET